MEGTDLIADALGRIQRTLERILPGLTIEQLAYRPSEGSNSITWLVWHLTRVQDHHISDLLDREQEWISGGWHERFGLAADPRNTGFGHDPSDVSAVRANGETLQGYYDAVYSRSLELLNSLNPEELDREINEPQYEPLPTVGTRLVSIVNDNTQHVGQAAYLKGLGQGTSWGHD